MQEHWPILYGDLATPWHMIIVWQQWKQNKHFWDNNLNRSSFYRYVKVYLLPDHTKARNSKNYYFLLTDLATFIVRPERGRREWGSTACRQFLTKCFGWLLKIESCFQFIDTFTVCDASGNNTAEDDVGVSMAQVTILGVGKFMRNNKKIPDKKYNILHFYKRQKTICSSVTSLAETNSWGRWILLRLEHGWFEQIVTNIISF